MKFEVDVQIERSAAFRLTAQFSCDARAIGIIGSSGSGKSTLLEAMAGIQTGSRLRIDAIDYSGKPLHRREFGYVSQEPLLFPHLSIRENLLFSPRAQSTESLNQIAAALGISALLDRMPRNLSGGERRRAALARALLSQPRLLLLDEPFGGLDEIKRREAMALLTRIRRQFQIPMVLVSHVAEEIIGLTDWALRLEAGHIENSGPSLSLLRAGETRIDNYLIATVAKDGSLWMGPQRVFASVPANLHGAVCLGCYAHEVLLATSLPKDVSARNVFKTQICGLKAIGDVIMVELSTPSLAALVTQEAGRALGLQLGKEVYALMKATSIVYLGQANEQTDTFQG